MRITDNDCKRTMSCHFVFDSHRKKKGGTEYITISLISNVVTVFILNLKTICQNLNSYLYGIR